MERRIFFIVTFRKHDLGIVRAGPGWLASGEGNEVGKKKGRARQVPGLVMRGGFNWALLQWRFHCRLEITKQAGEKSTKGDNFLWRSGEETDRSLPSERKKFCW